MDSVRRLFALDPRSIALFRRLLGVALLADVISRLGVVSTFYSDAGVFPRALLLEHGGSPHLFSLLLLSGNWWWPAFLLTVLGALAVALIFRRAVRPVSGVAFVLLLSVQHRNPHLLFGADILLRTGLLWSALLPRHGERERLPVVGACVLLQIAMIYFCAGWAKGSDPWFWHPTAGFYALSVDFYATAFGHELLGFPRLLAAGTVVTFLLERLGWLLFFLPWQTDRARLIGIVLFMGLHLGFALTMELGLFPILDIIFLFLLLPPTFWTWARAPHFSEGGTPWATWATAVTILFFMGWWNLCEFAPEGFHLPARVGWAMRATGIAQGWRIFSPEPMRESGFFIAVGTKADGDEVDPLNLRDEPPRFSRPANVAWGLPNLHWIQYLVKIALQPRRDMRARLGEYLCERWRQNNQSGLKTVDFYYLSHLSLQPGAGAEPQKRALLHQDCPSMP